MPPRRAIKSPTQSSSPTSLAAAAAPKPSASGAVNEAALALMEQGTALFKEGEFLKAAGMYAKAAKKDPENPTVHCNLAYGESRPACTSAAGAAGSVLRRRPELCGSPSCAAAAAAAAALSLE
eukprot:COSAG04_NODE_2834_length_3518_cov_3.351565_3_plen_123_part_00